MITEIKFKSGLLRKLMPTRKIKLSPGINVLWGSNGVGKSVLLRTIADHCFVDTNGGGGWSQDRLIGFHFSRWSNRDVKDLSDVYEFTKHSKIGIDWSGKPAFYMHHDDMTNLGYIMCYGNSWMKGIGDITGTVKDKYTMNASSGQKIKSVGGMLMDITPPDLRVDTTWKKDQGYDTDFITYIKERQERFKGNSKPLLLLDEVDSQLDMSNQIWFHEEFIPKLAEKYQIILASHSIFATKHENIFDIDGSLEIVKQKIKEL